uniref:Phosphotyrosine interaction domain containing 1 n=1 Tax=Mus musculus TaxID=10090 RepID=H3BJF2_MOUSE
MWQPATERLQHFQTMLKSKLNVLTLKKEPIPAVLFHEPEAIELCTTTPLMKARTHSGCKGQEAGSCNPPALHLYLRSHLPSVSCQGNTAKAARTDIGLLP